MRYVVTLLGIAVVVAMAAAVDVSGSSSWTLNLWRPVTLHQGLDVGGGTRLLLGARSSPGHKVNATTLEAARRIVAARVEGGYGIPGAVVQTMRNRRGRYVVVELPAMEPVKLQDVERLVSTVGRLTLVKNGATLLRQQQASKGFPVLATSADVQPSSVAIGTDTNGAPAVDFALSGAAAARVDRYTAAHVSRVDCLPGTCYFMAIAIDGKVFNNPLIREAAPHGNLQIRDTGSYAQTHALAVTLRYGALPVPLKIVGIQAVSASLGPANVQASLLAGGIGLLIVILFMAIYYRLPGLLADCALIIYALVVFATFKVIPVTLTLAGIAGFILSIGMAVDANILIFERMKEELRAGRSIGAATDAGFARAWPSIRDSNISTMITCAILYWFGNTFAATVISGFATTLFIGVLISMLTAILVSRTFLRLASHGTFALVGHAGLVRRAAIAIPGTNVAANK